MGNTESARPEVSPSGSTQNALKLSPEIVSLSSIASIPCNLSIIGDVLMVGYQDGSFCVTHLSRRLDEITNNQSSTEILNVILEDEDLPFLHYPYVGDLAEYMEKNRSDLTSVEKTFLSKQLKEVFNNTVLSTYPSNIVSMYMATGTYTQVYIAYSWGLCVFDLSSNIPTYTYKLSHFDSNPIITCSKIVTTSTDASNGVAGITKYVCNSGLRKKLFLGLSNGCILVFDFSQMNSLPLVLPSLLPNSAVSSIENVPLPSKNQCVVTYTAYDALARSVIGDDSSEIAEMDEDPEAQTLVALLNLATESYSILTPKYDDLVLAGDLRVFATSVSQDKVLLTGCVCLGEDQNPAVVVCNIDGSIVHQDIDVLHSGVVAGALWNPIYISQGVDCEEQEVAEEEGNNFVTVENSTVFIETSKIAPVCKEFEEQCIHYANCIHADGWFITGTVPASEEDLEQGVGFVTKEKSQIATSDLITQYVCNKHTVPECVLSYPLSFTRLLPSSMLLVQEIVSVCSEIYHLRQKKQHVSANVVDDITGEDKNMPVNEFEYTQNEEPMSMEAVLAAHVIQTQEAQMQQDTAEPQSASPVELQVGLLDVSSVQFKWLDMHQEVVYPLIVDETEKGKLHESRILVVMPKQVPVQNTNNGFTSPYQVKNKHGVVMPQASPPIMASPPSRTTSVSSNHMVYPPSNITSPASSSSTTTNLHDFVEEPAPTPEEMDYRRKLLGETEKKVDTSATADATRSMAQNRTLAQQNIHKLKDMGDRSEKMAKSGEDFAEKCKQLRQKQQNSFW